MTPELLPERIWLRVNKESRFGVGAVWSPTLELDFNIEYVRAAPAVPAGDEVISRQVEALRTAAVFLDGLGTKTAREVADYLRTEMTLPALRQRQLQPVPDGDEKQVARQIIKDNFLAGVLTPPRCASVEKDIIAALRQRRGADVRCGRCDHAFCVVCAVTCCECATVTPFIAPADPYTRGVKDEQAAEAERIKIAAYLSYDTKYSDEFCVRCSHCPSNCECANPVYMAGWKPDDKLKALKVALFQEDFSPRPTPETAVPRHKPTIVGYASHATCQEELAAARSEIDAAYQRGRDDETSAIWQSAISALKTKEAISAPEKEVKKAIQGAESDLKARLISAVEQKRNSYDERYSAEATTELRFMRNAANEIIELLKGVE